MARNAQNVRPDRKKARQDAAKFRKNDAAFRELRFQERIKEARAEAIRISLTNS